ncbi:unnamed protein product [Paramecium pentaurelia]|uniref:EF-hand domain-containing protein n=1 Tax=Paramecium pentaurelia TaxID=43138 RepID=A0A8S1XMR9_9CILI|nr:unnamed protein product [Paramecium pentaurelia]
MIRFGKSSQQTTKNPKKPDNLEILTLLDNCTLIFKDDRIALRNMVKDGNQDVISILNNYKKITNHKEMSTELRKYLRKKGEKENEKAPQCQSPKSNNNQKLFQQQPQQFPNSQKKSCPDLWKSADTSSPKIINLAKTKEITNDVQLSEIILTDRNQNETKDLEKIQYYSTNNQQYIQQLQPTFDKSERNSNNIQQDSEILYSQNQQFLEKDIDINEKNDYIESESSNESILKQMTEPPLQLIQDQTIKNDIKPTQLFSSQNSSYLQINIAQSYLQPALTQQPDLQQNFKQSVEQQNKERIQVGDPHQSYSFFNYQDCQILAQTQYKHLFTNWPTLLHKLDKPEYIPNYKSVLYIDTTPEYLFTLLFPNSAYIRINYFQFSNQLKQTSLQINIDELFKVLDKDGDDWINYRETGSILESICLQQEQPRNFIRELFESLKQPQSSSNAITLIDLQQLERIYQFQFARQLMQEIDIYQNGNLTYWDLFMHRDIYLMQKLCELVIQYQDQYNNQEQQQ